MTVVVRSASTPPQPAAVDDRAKSALKGEVHRREAEGLAGRVRGSVLNAADAVVDERLLAPPLASRSDDGLHVVAELGGPVSAAYVRALRLESDAAFAALAQIGGSDAVLGLAERAARSGPRRAAALDALMRLAMAHVPEGTVVDGSAPMSPRAVDAWTRGLAPLRESAIANALLTLDEIAAEEPRATAVRDAVLAAAEPLLDRAPGVQTVSLAGVPQPVVEELARLFRKAEEFERLYHVAQGQVQLASDRAAEAQRRYTELKARGPQGQPRGPRPDRPQREGGPSDAGATGAPTNAEGATDVANPAQPGNNAPPPGGGAPREPQYVLGPDGQPVLGPDGQPLRKKRRRRRRRGGRGGGAPGAPGAPNAGDASAGDAGGDDGADEGGDDGGDGGDEGGAPPTT